MSFTPTILLYRGLKLIRWQTRSEFGHAALRVAEDEIIEATFLHGVRSRPADDLQQAHEFRVPDATAEQWMAAVAFARSQMGKPYDTCGVLRFISRRPESLLRWKDSWFCSELVFAALQAGGVGLLERVPAWAVSPGMISHSPLLRPVTTGSLAARIIATLRLEDPRVREWRAAILAP